MFIDLLILSNGPGEITTWVRPVVKALRQKWENNSDQLRISVILSPCPNGTGQEAAIAQTYPEVDRVQSSESFFNTLLWGKTAENWDWASKGAVIFLGGDQAFALIIAKRLGYKTIIYAEWEARWYRWVDRFGVRNEAVKANVPPAYQPKCEVIGDLMIDLPYIQSDISPSQPIIGFMPGSKATKLTQGVPLALAIASHLHQTHSDLQFILPVAPTLTPEALAGYADPQQNPFLEKMGGTKAVLEQYNHNFYLKTEDNVQIRLITQYPAYESLAQCSLVLTTVGANTAELAALAVPMLVLLPTQQLDAMKGWDGIGGLLMRMPVLGSWIAKTVNHMILKLILKQGKLFAWPNIWANKAIVPELVGELPPQRLSHLILDYLNHPQKLQQMREDLQQIRGESGAADRLATLIYHEINP